MKKLMIIASSLFFLVLNSFPQKIPTGNPADFRLKTCLHSVTYMGV
ncbi:MAG: hypothetical protein Q8868_13670 [Bacteroidota bacterium]|nr:hypothetical protein [Bacteroidota bacterium]